jgi:hypothetical protein
LIGLTICTVLAIVKLLFGLLFREKFVRKLIGGVPDLDQYMGKDKASRKLVANFAND